MREVPNLKMVWAICALDLGLKMRPKYGSYESSTDNSSLGLFPMQIQIIRRSEMAPFKGINDEI